MIIMTIIIIIGSNRGPQNQILLRAPWRLGLALMGTTGVNVSYEAKHLELNTNHQHFHAVKMQFMSYQIFAQVT